MVFHWSLSDSKSPQFSWTLLSILADFNNTVVYMVSILPLFSNSSHFFPSFWRLFQVYQLQLVASLLLCSNNIFSCQARSKHLYIFLFSFLFTLKSVRTAKSIWWQGLFPLLINTGFVLHSRIRWSVCILKFQRILSDSFF